MVYLFYFCHSPAAEMRYPTSIQIQKLKTQAYVTASTYVIFVNFMIFITFRLIKHYEAAHINVLHSTQLQ